MDHRIFVAQLNIELFRRKLAEEQDASMKETLVHLLAEEETKLAVLQYPRQKTA